ncbi:unnamed protein product [Nezara viridula]|uniref:Uncharacterized protein n=1 Tax=Nezara viridula TaxID=85310 RepID=A0A9P0GZ09_NEZVI|nr:unnamed protein product [Nezara viridula]
MSYGILPCTQDHHSLHQLVPVLNYKNLHNKAVAFTRIFH